MKKFLLFLLVFSFSMRNIAYSQLIVDCRESKKKFEKSLKHTTLTPVTITEMSEILKNDKKIKIVVKYSACFPKNLEYIENVILPYWNTQDKSEVSLYLIAADCGYLKGIEEFFVKNNLDIKRYYYRDNSDTYRIHGKNINDNRQQDIQKSHFINGGTFPSFSVNGFNWFVADANNFVKLALYKDRNLKNIECEQLLPIMIDSLPKDIRDVKFETVDTLQLPKKSMVTEIIKNLWTY